MTRRVLPKSVRASSKATSRRESDAFGQRHFGDAHQELTAALMLKKDPEVFLYLAYTQGSLGEEAKMAETLDQGIEAFPYEVRLYQLYIKTLAAKGEKKKALTLLDRAIKMNPDDQNLLFLKDYVEAMNRIGPYF